MLDRSKKTITMRVRITDETHRLDDEETADFVAETMHDSYLGAEVTVEVADDIVIHGEARALAHYEAE